jgi:cytoplasmic iron level regulating protein YaaA (DUF328/UPF0246 family)
LPAVAARSLILIPPSEGKADGGDGPPWTAGTMAVAELDAARSAVLRALGRRHPARTSPTTAAIDRYTGVLYKELDAASLPAVARRRLDRTVLISSGLWGLVAPSDPIPEYKLKMSASVAPLGKLSTWWRPQVTAALAPLVHRRIVWDLFPLEHRASVDWSALTPRERVTVRFVDARGATVSHWNKLLKGSLVRWLAITGAADVAALEDFEHPLGYVLDPASTEADGATTQLTFRQRA